MKLTALFLALLTAALPAAAVDNDLVNCIYGDTGLPIAPNVCSLLRIKEPEERAARAERARVREASQAAAAERERERERARVAAEKEAVERAARLRAEAAEIRAQSVADQAARARAAEVAAERERAYAAADAERRAAGEQAMREIEAAEEQHDRRMAKLKRECGADFQAPRVGMSLDRAKRCVGDLKLYGQNGPVSAYRAGSLVLSVVDGKITKWVVFQGL